MYVKFLTGWNCFGEEYMEIMYPCLRQRFQGGVASIFPDLEEWSTYLPDTQSSDDECVFLQNDHLRNWHINNSPVHLVVKQFNFFRSYSICDVTTYCTITTGKKNKRAKLNSITINVLMLRLLQV